MSFAYIDSQGKEVPIPGPDALRLRIELGAITDSTQFYDAGADRWAPASEHEIYRQLQRDISASQSGGFTAPPPSTIGPDVPGPFDGPDTVDSAPVDPADAPQDADAFEPWDPEPSPASGIGHELDGIVAAGADDDPSHDDLFYPQGATADELDAGMDGFTLADLDAPVIGGDEEELDSADTGDRSGSDVPAEDSSDEADAPAGDGMFDFGSAGLELDEAEEELDDAGTALASDVVSAEGDAAEFEPADADDSMEPEAAGAVAADTPDFGMAFEGGVPEDDFAAEPEAEDPDESSDETEAGEGEAAGSSDGSEAASGDDPYRRTVRERRGPRSKPPRRPGEGGGAGRMVAIVAGLVVIAGGAWFVTRDSGGEAGSDRPVIILPELPAELQPQLQAVARSAMQATVAEFDSLPERLALAAEPADRWLSGAYLANASAYPGVREYWDGVGALVDRMMAVEDATWDAALEQALAAASLAANAETPLRNRAHAGWDAAAPDRGAVYDELGGVVDASLELHAFLLRNEGAITFAPGTGGAAGDPVLEAVPDTPELGDAMWDLVGDITIALDALGYLQQVETESLMDRVKAKLAATGFR